MDLHVLCQRSDRQPSRRPLRLFLPHLVRSLAPHPPPSRQPRAIVRQLRAKITEAESAVGTRAESRETRGDDEPFGILPPWVCGTL